MSRCALIWPPSTVESQARGRVDRRAQRRKAARVLEARVGEAWHVRHRHRGGEQREKVLPEGPRFDREIRHEGGAGSGWLGAQSVLRSARLFGSRQKASGFTTFKFRTSSELSTTIHAYHSLGECGQAQIESRASAAVQLLQRGQLHQLLHPAQFRLELWFLQRFAVPVPGACLRGQVLSFRDPNFLVQETGDSPLHLPCSTTMRRRLSALFGVVFLTTEGTDRERLQHGAPGHPSVVDCIVRWPYPGLLCKRRCHLEDLIRETDAGEDWRVDPVLREACQSVVDVACKDIDKLCKADENNSPGKVEECLKNKFTADDKDMKEACRIQVAEMIEEAKADINVDPLLQKACAVDVSKYCGFVIQGAGRPARAKLAAAAIQARATAPTSFESSIASVSPQLAAEAPLPPATLKPQIPRNDTSINGASHLDKKPRGRGFFRSILCCFGRDGRTGSSKSSKASSLQGDGRCSPPPGTGSPHFLLPPIRHLDMHKKCMVIDLDETLVHSSFKPINNADFVVPVEIDGTVHQVYVLKRPYVDEFLQRMGELYECVLFTASLAKYADPVADLLDRWGVFRARLFRESCVFHKGNYVKDLNKLGRDLEKIIIIDNSPASYIFHPDNAVPVASWFDDMTDSELLDLIPFFEKLSNVENIYKVLSNSNRPYNQMPSNIMKLGNNSNNATGNNSSNTNSGNNTSNQGIKLGAS
ncbi:unnamed protein product [Trichogramma brassicae]|uniref:protein-serine/threonine phosphatase n=1 Tax=Trichogramma brassicae TaxID=86971 RepID=A0A6H5IIA8_9HYME|nr:unnamed protein product [Trichogramma brassicae]